MANIAQTINVLQAMILTEGEKMILTPTYHVFDMFKVHHDATLLAVDGNFNKYELDGDSLPQASVSASRDENGKIHISLCNLDHQNTSEIEIDLRGINLGAATISGTILTADKMNAHNTFEQPENVKPVEFTDVQVNEQSLSVTLHLWQL